MSYTYGAQSASYPDVALSKPHAVVSAWSNTYFYDMNGNQVKRTIGGSAYTLAYDAENRPSGCALRASLSGVSGAATATFVYDGDGVRVKETAGEVTTAYVGGLLRVERQHEDDEQMLFCWYNPRGNAHRLGYGYHRVKLPALRPSFAALSSALVRPRRTLRTVPAGD